MENEYYYRQELVNKMEKFIEEQAENHPFGWLTPGLSKRMADAAFLVLEQNKESSEYVEEQNQ